MGSGRNGIKKNQYPKRNPDTILPQFLLPANHISSNGNAALYCPFLTPDTGSRINLTCNNVGYDLHAGVTLAATSLADNLRNPCGFPRHGNLGGFHLLIVSVQEGGRPHFTITNLMFFILKKSAKKDKKSQKALTLALFGPSIQGSITLIGPSTLPFLPLSTLPELSVSNLIRLCCIHMAHFPKQVRVVGGEVGDDGGDGVWGVMTGGSGSEAGGRCTMGIISEFGSVRDLECLCVCYFVSLH